MVNLATETNLDVLAMAYAAIRGEELLLPHEYAAQKQTTSGD
jgi:hypothetical protein